MQPNDAFLTVREDTVSRLKLDFILGNLRVAVLMHTVPP